MKIGFLSTRLAGTDGVSLETAKLVTIVRRLGHQVYYCAGELEPAGPPGLLVPEMHFDHPEAHRIYEQMFLEEPGPDLHRRVVEMAEALRDRIDDFVSRFAIDLLFLQNVLAIPMQIPLGMALTDYVQATGIPTIAHHHDLYWERPRFKTPALPCLLERCFPPDLPSIRHLVINSLAQKALRDRKGIEANLLPNVFDFATPPPEPGGFVEGMWADLGLAPGARVILQPTRVVPRKGIELAAELVRRLDHPGDVLVITHHAGDEGLDYLHEIQALAERVGVDLRYLAERFAPQRSVDLGGTKTYSLWDAYPQADFVTYPSFIEGFGNAFLEAVYFRQPLLVNRYPVYEADIGPLGFRCVEVDGAITGEAVDQVRRLLADADLREEIVAHNFELARAHFSYEAVTPLLEGVIGAFA